MRKAIKIVELAWLFVAAASIVEIVRLWGTEGATKLYYFSLPIAIFMFFFRRRQRKKMEKYQEQKRNNTE